MGKRGKRPSPVVEFEEEDAEELAYLAKLVEEELTPPPMLANGGFSESDLEEWLERLALSREAWYEVYWSG